MLPPLATDPAEWTSPPPGWLGIRLLGAPQLVYQDEALSIAGKPLEFVLYLAAHRCRPVGAETIVTALWPNEGSLDTLRGRLQAAVSRAREALRGYFADGRIHLRPQPEGYYVAETQLFPLVPVTKEQRPRGTGPSATAFGCAGWI